jgi:hypothetical protein
VGDAIREITFVIIMGETKAYCSEVLQAIPAHPSGKGRLEARYSFGEMKKVE